MKLSSFSAHVTFVTYIQLYHLAGNNLVHSQLSQGDLPEVYLLILFFIWEFRAWNSDWKSYYFSDILSLMELILISSIIQTLNIVHYLERLKCTELHSHQVNIWITITSYELNNFSSGLYAVILWGGFSVHRMHILHSVWQCKTTLRCTALEILGVGLGNL